MTARGLAMIDAIATIRPEEPGDVAAIHAVHAAAFPSAAEAGLVDALRSSGRLAVSLLAQAGSEVVGHIAFSPVTAAGGAAGLGLAPVSVLSGFRRRGIGALLVRRGLEVCRDRQVPFVVVLGDPWYAGFGFRPASQWGLSDEYGGGDAFQAIELTPGGLPAPGLVRYAPEFAAFV